MSIAFRCSNSSCMQGGICTGQDDVCVSCAPGWTHDFVGFAHQRNCALPTNLTLIFFIVYSVLCALCAAAVWYEGRRARAALKWFRNFYVAWTALSWINVLVVFAEEGYYEGSNVITGLHAGFATVCTAVIVLEVLKAYFVITPAFPAQLFRRLMLSCVVIWNAVACGLLFTAAGVSRDPTQIDLYNTLIVVWFIVQFVCNTLYGLIMVGFLYLLKQHVRAAAVALGQAGAGVAQGGNGSGQGAGGANRVHLKDFKGTEERLSNFIKVGFASLIIPIFDLLCALVFIYYGSVPFLWVKWIFLMSQPVQNCNLILQVVRSRLFHQPTEGENSSTSPNPSKGDSSQQHPHATNNHQSLKGGAIVVNDSSEKGGQ